MDSRSRAPRLIIVSSQFHPAVGGAERQALQLAVALRQQHRPVAVLTLHDPRRPKTCGWMPVPIVGITFPRIRVIGPLLAYLRGALALRRLARREPSVVQLQTLDQLTLVVGLAAVGLRIPVIVRISGAVEMSDGYLSQRRGLRPRLARWLLRHSARVLALNPEIEQRLRDLGVDDRAILRLPNAIPDKFFALPDPEARARSRTDHVDVLSVGRLDKFKGGDVLLRAWQSVTRSKPDAHLTMVGDGPERSNLEALARNLSIGDTVSFTGTSFDVAEQYGTAGLFVLPSIQEGMPNALLEAMAAGLPCVASDLPGTRGIVEDGTSGMLVPAGDPQALAGALIELLGDERTRQKLGLAARERVRPWASSHLVETHMDLHRKVCA